MPILELVFLSFAVFVIFLILYFAGIINLKVNGLGESGWYSNKYGLVKKSNEDASDFIKDMHAERSGRTYYIWKE